MRLAFVSDIHGNLPALTAVLDDIEGRGADEVICLGDIVDLGPQSPEVIALLRERGIPCIEGNHDGLDEQPDVPVLRDIEVFTADQLTPEDRQWLDGLPFSVRRESQGVRILGVHGSPRRTTQGMRPEMGEVALGRLLEGTEADVVVCGHTHVPLVWRVGRVLVVNVGSVGQAFYEAYRGEEPRCMPYAEYGIIEVRDGQPHPSIHRVPYDIETYARALRTSGMPHATEWMDRWVQ